MGLSPSPGSIEPWDPAVEYLSLGKYHIYHIFAVEMLYSNHQADRQVRSYCILELLEYTLEYTEVSYCFGDYPSLNMAVGNPHLANHGLSSDG